MKFIFSFFSLIQLFQIAHSIKLNPISTGPSKIKDAMLIKHLLSISTFTSSPFRLGIPFLSTQSFNKFCIPSYYAPENFLATSKPNLHFDKPS
ncbi:MAG: hypothetical protein IPK88_07510 [Saprospiraceae bacterium]|nr:hypothetical protein [Candidatus Defluviibacterium haderslevense]